MLAQNISASRNSGSLWSKDDLVKRSTPGRICLCGYSEKKEDSQKKKDGLLHKFKCMYMHVFGEHKIHGHEI